MAAAPPPGTVVLGTVSRPNGLTGAVVVHLHPSMHDVVRRGLAVSLLRDGAAPLATRVRSAGPVRGGLRVTFDGVSDRNAAEALVGARVLVQRDELGPMDEDEFLDSDIVGLETFSVDGVRLGHVVEVVATGANDVWVVKADDGREILVPAVAHAVDSVDLDAGRITVVAEALEYGEPPIPRGDSASRRAAKAPRA